MVWWRDSNFNYDPVKGAAVDGVAVTEDSARLFLKDGRTLRFDLGGECCSCSYFADKDQFSELPGSTLMSVEEREGPSCDGLEEDEYGNLKWYFLVFTTNKGHVTVDWRNESNGYYSGWLEATIEPAAPTNPDVGGEGGGE